MKTLDTFVLIALVAVLVVGLTPYVQGKIVSSGTATTGATGGSGTVTSITQGTGMSFSANPLITTGTVNLAEALTGTIGGVKVLNCSVGSSITGFSATNVPICTAGGSGTVTSIASGEGIVVNPSPIISTGTIMGANATTSARGIVQVANCSATQFVNGWNAGNVPSCATPSSSGGGTNFNWTFVDRVYFSKTKTNVGTTWVDVYNAAVDPEDTLINTTGTTQFRIVMTVDYVGAGTQSVNLNQTTNNANRLWWFNFTGDCDPCDSGWQNLPSWANSGSGIETFVEAQIVSTTSGDDPVFKGYQVWLR